LIFLYKFPRLFVLSASFIYLLTTSIIVFYGWQTQTADNLAGTFLVTLRFVPFFMAGIFLAKNHDVIRNYIIGWTKWQISMVIIMALFVFYMPTKIYNFDNMSALFSIITPDELNALMIFGVDFFLGVASCALIVLARNFGQNSKMLNSMIIGWLGKISYSLYLVHLPMTFLIFRLLLGKVEFVWICIITVIASVAAASLFFVIFEKQSVKVGKYLSGLTKK
ncbi:MAG: acyltransferase family protein, partial [Rickettsiales bacterium]